MATEKDFLRDVATHQMTIDQDDGVFRSIIFSRPGSSTYRFVLVTGPGFLLIRGDMGCFEFERIYDMFGFFPMSENDFNNLGPDRLSINPGYWSEKCEAQSRFGKGLREFSHDKFARHVRDKVKDFIEEGGLKNENEDWETREEQEKEFLSEVEDMIDSVEFEHEAHAALRDYEFDDFDLKATDVFGDDYWECNFEEFTYHYLWCCYAIVWGIQQYNQFKQQEAACPIKRIKLKISKSLLSWSQRLLKTSKGK